MQSATIEYAEEALEHCNECCCCENSEKKDDTTDIFSSEQFEEVYGVGRVLGKGGFGVVYAGIRKKDRKLVAIKHIPKKKVAYFEKLFNRKVPLEVALMDSLKKVDGAIQLLDYFERPDSYIIVMERPEDCKDLFDYVTDKGTLDEKTAKGFFKQIVEIVLSFMERGVIHRDIKDENILVNTKTGKLKIVDFGSGAFIKDSESTEFEGTRVYAPPEWIRCSRYLDHEAAVWSLGILLHVMVCGEIPFETDDEICDAELVFKNNVSGACRGLIKSCLRIRPRDRIKLKDILHHPWMNEEEYLGPNKFVNSYEDEVCLDMLNFGRRRSIQ